MEPEEESTPELVDNRNPEARARIAELEEALAMVAATVMETP